MQVIYRMRGLLGDATEDMVNSLDTNTEEDVDKEEVYRMANVLATGGGLRVMLDRYVAHPWNSLNHAVTYSQTRYRSKPPSTYSFTG